jgi:hypothetical protein
VRSLNIPPLKSKPGYKVTVQAATEEAVKYSRVQLEERMRLLRERRAECNKNSMDLAAKALCRD